MNCLNACVLLALTVHAASAAAQTTPAPTRPNIIYIMSDDHAAHAIGAHGSRVITTPNIDRLLRYYHDPGDHNTRAHYSVRTRTHKLIYFWKKDQWELFDLVHDPHELRNLYGQPGQQALTARLKAKLARLKKEVGHDDQLADEPLPNGVDGPVAKFRGR
jgi:arylsulfatase A-like enzyme